MGQEGQVLELGFNRQVLVKWAGFTNITGRMDFPTSELLHLKRCHYPILHTCPALVLSSDTCFSGRLSCLALFQLPTQGNGELPLATSLPWVLYQWTTTPRRKQKDGQLFRIWLWWKPVQDCLGKRSNQLLYPYAFCCPDLSEAICWDYYYKHSKSWLIILVRIFIFCISTKGIFKQKDGLNILVQSF